MPTQQTPSYANYLMPTSGNSVIDPTLGNDYLSNLENTLNLQEGQQMNQLLAQQNQLGTVSSGNTNYGLAQIAGNTQNQFANAYTGLANQATGQAQQQQFGTQYEQQGFQNQLQAQQQQAAYQQQLLELQASLGMGAFQFQPNLPSFGATFGNAYEAGLPSIAGGAASGAFGGMIGGMGAGASGVSGYGSPGSLNLQGASPYGNPGVYSSLGSYGG